MATIREFTSEDWFGFAGAESFDDAAPLIVDDFAIEPWRIAGTVYQHVLVVVDQHGADIFFANDEGDQVYAHRWRKSPTVAEGRDFATEILSALEAGALPAGFEIGTY